MNSCTSEKKGCHSKCLLLKMASQEDVWALELGCSDTMMSYKVLGQLQGCTPWLELVANV